MTVLFGLEASLTLGPTGPRMMGREERSWLSTEVSGTEATRGSGVQSATSSSISWEGREREGRRSQPGVGGGGGASSLA